MNLTPPTLSETRFLANGHVRVGQNSVLAGTRALRDFVRGRWAVEPSDGCNL
jgi:hypothetical protein